MSKIHALFMIMNNIISVLLYLTSPHEHKIVLQVVLDLLCRMFIVYVKWEDC